MKYFIRFVLVCFLPLLFFSCTCSYKIECNPELYSLQLRIVRASDSSDLVFGSQRLYDWMKVRVYSLEGWDTTYFEVSPFLYGPTTPPDSILNLNFYHSFDTAYLRFSNGDVDTLAMTYDRYKTRCCGAYSELTHFRLNNRVDIPANSGKQVITK